MKLSFVNFGKNGSLILQDGKVLQIEVVSERQKTILKDLFSSSQTPTFKTVESNLKKMGFTQIEVSTPKASIVDAWLEDKNISGAIYLRKNGQTLLSKGYGFFDIKKQKANTASTLFYAHEFSQIILASLIHERFDLSESIDTYFPAETTRFPDKKAITLQMLIDQTSGLEESLPTSVVIDHFVPMQMQVDQIFKKPLLSTPGSCYSPSRLNYTLLAALLEKTSYSSYKDVLTHSNFEYLVDGEQTTATLYDAIGKQISKNHISMRVGSDDLVATAETLLFLFQLAKPHLTKTTTIKKFDQHDVVTTSCSFICDFIFGKRVYMKISDYGLLFFAPSCGLEVALIANKPLSENFCMKKFISLITTNHF